jgi:signal transduction histidine kinase
VKNTDFITANQFQKLARFKGLTNQHLSRAHYDIIFKNVIKRSDISLMDIENFFEAIETIVNKLYPKEEDMYDKITSIIMEIDKQLL